MAKQYRDMGTMNGLSSNPQEVVTQRRSQVYQATHVGENSLPYMNRSFISFTYGGKKIEDFNLIATISGDRMSRSGYASFEDITTTYDNLDGQYYWATHYTTNQMDFVLSTDGILQYELDEFLHWFRAGIARELVLAEHPNRAIMARVSQPPQLDLLPFEYDTQLIVDEIPYPAKTTIYKGDISLSLIMDDPHWYAINNILGRKTTKNNRTVYEDYWFDVTTNDWVFIFDSPDALKTLYEDGIPLGSMIKENMLLGNGSFANVQEQPEGSTWTEDQNIGYDDWLHITNPNFYNGSGARIDGTVTEEQYARVSSVIGTEDYQIITNESGTYINFDIPYDEEHQFADEYPIGITYVGVIAGAVIDATENGIVSLSAGTNGYFFYAGTAPSYTTISFKLLPQMDNQKYIIVPRNDYVSGNGNPYNIITVESLNKQELQFTTPNLITSYNKSIRIFRNLISNNEYSYEDIRENLRDDVRHPRVRAWAIRIIDSMEKATSRDVNGACRLMSYFFADDDNGNISHYMQFSFNSRTGEAIGKMYCRIAPNNTPTFATFTNSLTNFSMVTEDVGDMLRSNYIIIQDRNYPTNIGTIDKWNNVNDITRQYSHRVTHDVATGLSNLQILYKNMYL